MPDQGAGIASGNQLQDIVVTAERREQRLQDVPVAVTALPAEELERRQVVDVLTLSKLVPGMRSQPTLTPLEITTSIRGVTQLAPNVTIDPPIGTYVDGIYTAVNAGSNLAMIDMERVEVLKGPQGTLFGRNTIGGSISITTAKPVNHFEGYVEGQLGNYDERDGTAVLNIPAGDTLAMRFVYQHAEHGGYGHNLTTGDPTSTLHQNYTRESLLWTPSTQFDALVSGFFVNSKGFSAPARLRYFDPDESLAPGILPPNNVFYPAASGNPSDKMSNYIGRGGFYDGNGDLPDRFHLKGYGFTGTLTGHLGQGVSVKSITGYTHTAYDTAADIDGTPYVYVDVVGFPIRARQFSQELQIYGDTLDKRLSYIAGVYYFNESGSQFSESQVLTALSPTQNMTGPDVHNRSYSAFGQLTYEVLPGLRLTGGARYVRDTRHVNYLDQFVTLGSNAFISCQLASYPFGTDPTLCSFQSSVAYHYVPWTVGIDYKPSAGTLLYAKISKGYRSGAYSANGPAAVAVSAAVTPAQAAAANALAVSIFGPAAPENILSPEVGAKLDLLNRKLRINVAAYYSDYKNIQLIVNLPTDSGCSSCSPPVVLTNSGVAHIYGGEIEMTAILGKLQLDASAGYTHPKYVSGPNVGDPVINVSKFNGALTATLPIEFRPGTLSLSSTFSYRSKAILYSLSPAQPTSLYSLLGQKGYGTLDGRISFELRNIPLTLSVFASNFTNTKYYVAASDFASPLSFVEAYPGVPRLFGGSAKYRF